MALLLNIDTATNYGAVALSYNGEIINIAENLKQKEHAAFLHGAISKVLEESGRSIVDIDAVVAVTGPGSYTGLRVALSAAKGLCYAAQKPLVAVNTLQAIALATLLEPRPQTDKPILYVPMIDARRMEVFMAVYDEQNELHTEPAAMIVDNNFLTSLQHEFFLVYTGNGSKKLEGFVHNANQHFSHTTHHIQQVVTIGEKRFAKGLLEDVAYCEPFYLKPVFTTTSVKK